MILMQIEVLTQTFEIGFLSSYKSPYSPITRVKVV